MNHDAVIASNVEQFRQNPYPGRGMIIGLSPDSRKYCQVYFITGRSVNSRNRILVREGEAVKTKAFDESKMSDPSLIIYYPVRVRQGAHIVTNGDQTDTIVATLEKGGSFEAALDTREFEPDEPNFTPRISGMVDLNDQGNAYRLSILKSLNHDPRVCIRSYYNYSQAIPGMGHCLHTYQGNGDPLPSFSGDPYLMPLSGEIEETARFYWDLLDVANRVCLLAKEIDRETGLSRIKVINQLEHA
jgi:IMP cyclohydrolase